MYTSKLLTAAVTLVLSTVAANAETIEIKMLNKGEAGPMVFEPAFVSAQVGDTIVFLATDKGHNVESIDGMLPDGVEPFASKMNQEYTMTLTEEGVYGLKCKPHYMMGMVALIQAGSPVNLDAAKDVKQKGKAKGRFEELLTQVQ